MNEQAIRDALFIQEVMNNLYKNDMKGTKAWYLLRDWSRELRETSGLVGKRKKTFCKEVGRELYYSGY